MGYARGSTLLLYEKGFKAFFNGLVAKKGASIVIRRIQAIVGRIKIFSRLFPPLLDFFSHIGPDRY
jgi:hypothetical protein